MNINDNGQREWLRSILSDFYWFVIIMTIWIGIIVSCTSCSSPRPVVLERTYHDTVHINNIRLDSIFQHDSIYFESIIKGDTVYRTKEITRWRDRVSIKRDTVYAVREKSVDVPVSQEQTGSLWLGFFEFVYILILLAGLIYSLIKVWRYHRKY